MQVGCRVIHITPGNQTISNQVTKLSQNVKKKSAISGWRKDLKEVSKQDDTDIPRGKGNSSLRPTQKPGTGASRQDVILGTIMGITLPLSLLAMWYITIPLLGYCTVSLLGAETVETLFYVKEDMMSYLTSECPLWIAAKERAYLENRSDQEIRRVTNITQREFIEIVKQGEPIVISDALRDWESFGLFNCEYFMDKYPEAEYFDWQGQKQLTLGNITHREGFKGMDCASGYMDMNWESNDKYVKEWLSKMKLPYFYPEDTIMESAFNYQGNKSPPMTGFLGVPGTGVSPHIDETCENFMTVQLSGVKHWSLSWPVREGDKLQWSKPLVVTLYPGEALMWYVSMRHHTEVIQDCSLSFSFTLKHPPPKDYYERLIQDFKRVEKTERDNLYIDTGVADIDFIDTCNLFETQGNVYIT
ncbi:LOW QUALITY PROTEIN: uncharacterized protein [Amphiura filiformis]|uniref:LOW QUALITY PROTEIN: uncharacterized protein n=1 Tax=Amphiura filiformis TaxID=82378 RepID=UPI003B20D2F4